jgi:hypothetical protein
MGRSLKAFGKQSPWIETKGDDAFAGLEYAFGG